MSEQKKRTELQVAAIENGSVLDHIPSEHLFKVAQLLGLEHMDHRITIGNNLKSSKMGHKGVIKIADKFFEEDEINRIAVVAPNVVLNTIRDYEVVEKRRVELPDELTDIIRCNNRTRRATDLADHRHTALGHALHDRGAGPDDGSR